MGSTSYIDDSLRSFLVKLGGKSPEPAGGAALALAGASAAALMSLTCHTTLGGSTSPDEQAVLSACQLQSEQLSARIQHLIDEDVRAYRAVTRSLRLPQATPDQHAERQRALDQALAYASEIPLEVVRACLDILDLVVRIEPSVSPPVMGDLAAAVHLAEAAIKGSLRNARINTGAMADQERAGEIRASIDDLARRARALAEQAEQALRARGFAE